MLAETLSVLSSTNSFDAKIIIFDEEGECVTKETISPFFFSSFSSLFSLSFALFLLFAAFENGFSLSVK